ncbi:MAG: DNA gyrase subunit A [Calditrichaeota bacterium]|nr:DNA gyrase subunit A [Calditrichota bacterium]
MTNLSENIIPVAIEEEMRKSYIDYSMSVIVARALPDVRDGLKPVHRRVLYGMLDLGLRPNSAYKKSARIVGEVLGKYHPHGDSAVYDAMVRMVQDFSLRYPLVDGQGNFGSIDGDSPAAMRYTEAKLANIAEEVVRDIEKQTVDFVPNFDDSLKEPSVLPSLLPTLLVNGAYGIAVGMATNIPPHNLNEVIDALSALIESPKLKSESLLKYLKGPDFPTGATIFGDEGIKSYFETGRGKLMVRARAHVEDMRGGRERIIVTEIPYQVSKGTLLERSAALVRDKKLDGITEIRDESDREGMRVVFELRKEVNAEKVLENLYKHTQLQTTFGVILLALVNGQPKVMSVKEMLQEFLEFRHKVVLRRTKFDLDKAEKRAHILEGLKKALDNIDEIIAIIKKSKNVDTARRSLIKTFSFSEIQAQAILDMRLQRLTGLERRKIEQEYLALIKLIEKLKSLLASKSRRMQLVKTELQELKEKYGDERKTQIIGKTTGKVSLTEMMKEDENLITISLYGIIKRTLQSELEKEPALLKPASGKDFVERVHVSANSHRLLFFTNLGRSYVLRSSFIPMAGNGDHGISLQHLLRLNPEEKLVFSLETDKFDQEKFIFLTTKNGLVKRVAFSSLASVTKEGSAVIGLKEGDELIAATLTTGEEDILLASAGGQVVRFNEQDVRDMGLQAGGIKGIELAKDDFVVDMTNIKAKKSYLFTVTTLGFGKRSSLEEYGRIRRGGKGIINFKLSPKTGKVAGILEVKSNEPILLFSRKGKIKKLRAKSIKQMGRASQGEVVAKVPKNDEIVKCVFLPQVTVK